MLPRLQSYMRVSYATLYQYSSIRSGCGARFHGRRVDLAVRRGTGGCDGYWLIHPVVFARMCEASVLRGSIYPITTYITAVYVGQLIVCSVLFLLGRGSGLLLGA